MPLLDDVYDLCRVLNMLLALVAGGLLTYKFGRQWLTLDIQAKFLYISAISFCAAAVWTAAESIAHDIAGGPRVLVMTLPLIWAVIAGGSPPDPARQHALRGYHAPKKRKS